MSLLQRVVVCLVFLCAEASADATLVDGVKITRVGMGIFGYPTFIVLFDPAGPGTGVCKSTGWVGFSPANWPRATNTAGVDTPQFDRVFSLMVTAFTTGQRLTLTGYNTDCNSGYMVDIYP